MSVTDPATSKGGSVPHSGPTRSRSGHRSLSVSYADHARRAPARNGRSGTGARRPSGDRQRRLPPGVAASTSLQHLPRSALRSPSVTQLAVARSRSAPTAWAIVRIRLAPSWSVRRWTGCRAGLPLRRRGRVSRQARSYLTVFETPLGASASGGVRKFVGLCKGGRWARSELRVVARTSRYRIELSDEDRLSLSVAQAR